MAVFTIPLNTGCNEHVDQRLLTDGRLRTVRNGRVDREGRIRVRAGYTALTMTADYGALYATDLNSFKERLIALGYEQGGLNPGYATDLFEYLGSVGASASRGSWGSSRVANAGSQRRLPNVTMVRDIPVVGDVPGGAVDGNCAARNGLAVVVWKNRGDSTAGITAAGYGRIINVETGQVLQSSVLLSSGQARAPRACALHSHLLVTAINGSVATGHQRELLGYLDQINGVGTTLISVVSGDLGIYAVAPVTNATGASTAGFVVAIVDAAGTGNVRVRRFTSTMGAFTPSISQYADIVYSADPTAIVVEADFNDNTLNVIAVDGADLKITSYNLATGATIGSPPYGATLQGADDLKTLDMSLGVCRYDATQIAISMYIARNTAPTATDAVRVVLYKPATNDESAAQPMLVLDAAPASPPIEVDGEVMIAVRRGAAEGLLVTDVSPADVVLVSLLPGTSGTPNCVVPLSAPDFGVAGSFQRLPSSLVQDLETGSYYWLRSALIGSAGKEVPRLTEMQVGSTDRRSMVELAGGLYIGGGVVLHYDGRLLTEASWLERPRIKSATASNSTGALDNSATYTYVAMWSSVSANGDETPGPVSLPHTMTTGAADDTGTIVVSVPLSMRLNAPTTLVTTSPLDGTSVLVKLYRNTNDLVDGVNTPGPNLQLVDSISIDQSHFPGETVTFTDTMADSTLENQEVIYTQVDTILDNHAPHPSDYLSTSNESIMCSGQPSPERWQISKPLQPAQTVAWAQNGVLAFEGRVQRGEIEQALGLSQSWMLITGRELLALQGSGPDASGKGEFQRSYRIPSDGGMRSGGWVSAVEFGKGTMFQLEDDQLYLWNGGTPQPVGLEIQDTMLEFPNVTAACHIKNQQCVALALQNDSGNDGCIVLWDQQTGQWYRDDVGAVVALAEYQGRLAYLQDGTVYLEDEDYGTGTAVTLTLATGNCSKTGIAGACGVERVLLTGVYQGDFTAELFIKYTDDQTFTSLGAIAFLASDGYAAGDPLDQEWNPQRDDTSRFELQVVLTGTTNTKLAWLNAIEVHLDADDGPKRLGDARRR